MKWYKRTWVIVLFLIFLWPVGIIFACLSPWKKSVKIAVVVIVAVLGIFSMSFARGFVSGVNTASSVSQQGSFYGVTYKVDPSWQKTDGSSSTRTFTIDQGDVISMQATDYTGYDVAGSKDALIADAKSTLPSTYSITSNLAAKEVKVGNYNACRFDFKMKDSSGIERTMTQYYVFFKDYIVTVTYGGPSSTYSSVDAEFTAFANSLSSSGDGSFATASKANSSTGLATSSSSSSSSSSKAASSSTNSYEAKATAFKNSLPSYCVLVTAADQNITEPDIAKAAVYFNGYTDSSHSSLVCYGTYFVVDSAATAKSEFDEGVQLMRNQGATNDTLVNGDNKDVWTCVWNNTACYMYRKDNAVLTFGGTGDSMQYLQTLASQLAC